MIVFTVNKSRFSFFFHFVESLYNIKIILKLNLK